MAEAIRSSVSTLILSLKRRRLEESAIALIPMIVTASFSIPTVSASACLNLSWLSGVKVSSVMDSRKDNSARWIFSMQFSSTTLPGGELESEGKREDIPGSSQDRNLNNTPADERTGARYLQDRAGNSHRRLPLLPWSMCLLGMTRNHHCPRSIYIFQRRTRHSQWLPQRPRTSPRGS